MRIRIHLETAVLVLVALFCLHGTAAAGAAEAKEAADALKVALKGDDAGAVTTAIERLASMHADEKDPKVRASLLDAIGGVLKSKHEPEVKGAAIVALGKSGDPKGAWKHLKGLVPSAKTKADDPLLGPTVEALSTLAPEEAVAPLLKEVQKGKTMYVAAQALTALGGYAKSPKQGEIVKAILEVLEKAKKDHAAGEKVKAPEKQRALQEAWNKLSEPGAAALDALAGHSLGDADAWLAAWKEAGHKVPELLKAAASGGGGAPAKPDEEEKDEDGMEEEDGK